MRDAAAGDIADVLRRLGAFRPATVVTSPARRCLVLADAIAATCGGRVVTDARLLELDFGDWEGVAWDDVPRASLDLWAADLAGFAPPGGESGTSLIDRASAAFRSLPQRGCHVVVSHGGPLRVLAALAAGEPVDLSTPAPAHGSVGFFHRDGRAAGHARVQTSGMPGSKAGLRPDPPGASRPWTGLT